MSFNDFVAWILRSPFYWLMGSGTLLITLTGRKSGKPVTLPVSFYTLDGAMWITSHRSRVWWRNLQANPDVRLWVGGRRQAGRGELILDMKAVAGGLARLFALDPRLASAFHVRLVDGAPDPQDLQRAASERLLIRISF
jgi:deazaflavin-dependent oxidoreductase (nitroreductase family)